MHEGFSVNHSLQVFFRVSLTLITEGNKFVFVFFVLVESNVMSFTNNGKYKFLCFSTGWDVIPHPQW